MQLLNDITNFFISNAHAANTAPAAQSPQSSTSFFVMMAVLIFFMYFAIWRPQSKRAKEQRQLLTSLTKGDEVVTAGGILGTLTKVMDNYVGLMLADNIEIIVQKASVASILPKGTIKSL